MLRLSRRKPGWADWETFARHSRDCIEQISALAASRPLAPARASSRPAAARQFVLVESYDVAVEVHLKRLVDQVSDRSKPDQSRLKETQLRLTTDVRDEDYKPGMEFLRGIEPTEITRIVGDADHVACQCEGDDVPILQASFSEMCEMVGVAAGALGFPDERRTQALVLPETSPFV